MMRRLLFCLPLLCMSIRSCFASEVILLTQVYPDDPAINLPIPTLFSENEEPVDIRNEANKFYISLKEKNSLASTLRTNLSNLPTGFMFFPIKFSIRFDNQRDLELPLILGKIASTREEVDQLRKDSAATELSLEQIIIVYQRSGMMLKARLIDIESSKRRVLPYDVEVAYIYLKSLNDLVSKSAIVTDDFKDKAADFLANVYASKPAMVQSAIGPKTVIRDLLDISKELVTKKYEALFSAIGVTAYPDGKQLQCPRYLKLQERVTKDARFPSTTAAARLAKNIVNAASDCQLKMAAEANTEDEKAIAAKKLAEQGEIIAQISVRPKIKNVPELQLRKIAIDSMVRHLRF
jgi:hypothetical protein